MSGTCRAAALLGQSCSADTSGSNCLDGWCDGTGHCAAYLAAGATCMPSYFQCSSTTNSIFTLLSDGGGSQTYVDASCLMMSGGYHCASTCQ